MPVPPLGVPKSLSLAFWAGLWGVAYALLEPRLTALLGWWAGGLVFGLALRNRKGVGIVYAMDRLI